MKKVLYILLGVFIIIQFIPANRPEVSFDNPNDLIANNPNIPGDVKLILKTSCYDCHSNETTYPWYSYVAPTSFMVSSHVKEGRKHINFSEWEGYKKSTKAEKLGDIDDEMEEGEMPLKTFTFIHRDAALSSGERKIISSWADKFSERLFNK
jgi:hypothetical protein